jgi:predicted nucleic acid-binding protein
MSADIDYQFVDTNILVYAHDLSAGAKRAKARDLILGLWDSQAGCLSVQVLQEFYVSVTQKVTIPVDTGEAASIIQELATWRVHAPGARDVLKAIELQQQYHMAFWDAMILNSAAQLGCKVIVSEDFNPGRSYGGIQATNPFL